MKSYSSLFPSYSYNHNHCEDDKAVFFQFSHHHHASLNCLNEHSSSGDNDDGTTRESSEIKYQVITGSRELVNLLKRAKAVSNSFGRKTFEELRGKTNYYEGLGKGCYLNRSAMKLVNLDYVFSLIEPSSATYATRSNPHRNDGGFEASNLCERPHFSFVDLCGGPGGFIECIVLKCRHRGIAVTGFGMTLLIGDEEPGFRGIMKACNWNIFHLQDPPYSIILSDQKEDSSCVTQLNSDSCSMSKDIAVDTNRKTLEENSYNPPSNERVTDESIKSSKSANSKNDCECRVFLVGGETGTGDICAPENMHSLFTLMQHELPLSESPIVDSSTKNRRCYSSTKMKSHRFSESDSREEEECSTETVNKKKYVSFVCCDGFDHETEAFRIVLCQVIGMIKTLQVGGNFIMKVFSCTKVQTVIWLCSHSSLVLSRPQFT